VCTAVDQFVRKFGGDLPLQLADFSFGFDSLLVMVWTLLSSLATLSWCAILGERCTPFCLAIQSRVYFRNDSLSRLRCSGVASAYGWVTIVILSMVKQAHPLYSNRSCISLCPSPS
jgi:hypothetical protein